MTGETSETHRVPDYQVRLPGCDSREVITRALDLVSPTHRQPASREDGSLLQLVDLGLREPGGGGSGGPLHRQTGIPPGDLKLQHLVVICSLSVPDAWPPTLALLLRLRWSEQPETTDGNSLELFVRFQRNGWNSLEFSDLISFS